MNWDAWERVKQTSKEWLAVIISVFSLVFASLISVFALLYGHSAHVIAQYEISESRKEMDRLKEELQDDIGVSSVRYANLLAWLRANGIDIPEELDE